MIARKIAKFTFSCFLGFFMAAGFKSSLAQESVNKSFPWKRESSKFLIKLDSRFRGNDNVGLIQSVPKERPVIAIIIDDMGNHLKLGQAAINLIGPVTYSFLPYSRYSVELAEQANANRKEVMLHVPMQALDDKTLGDGGLTWDMSETQVLESFMKQLKAVPHVHGVNNHMGSFLTQDYIYMGWIMEAIKRHSVRKLFFVDSRTTKFSIAKKMAEMHGVPSLKRDVFFDHEEDEEKIREQFLRLVSIAKKQGSAVGIGHPKKKTHRVLKEMLQNLDRYDVDLLSVSELLKRQNAYATNRENLDRQSVEFY